MSGKRRGGEFKKAHYYVWYLGWKEVRGVWGREFTEAITRELIASRRNEDLPKLTIEITRKELRIVQLVEKKKGKVDKLKYPPIPAKDVTYCVQALSPWEDVVSCIFLGFNPQTRCAVHVHVYRCDSPETAEMFTAHLNSLIDIPEHQKRIWRIEADLVAKGQVVPRPSAFVGPAPSEAPSTLAEPFDDAFENMRDFDQDRFSEPRYVERSRAPTTREVVRDRTPSPEPPPATVPFEAIYDSVTAELKSKLLGKETAGLILLPPKDYDTVHRKAGNLIADSAKAENIHIVGPSGGIIKIKKDSSGEDSAKGDSEEGSSNPNRLSANWSSEDAKSRNSGSGKGSRPNSRPGSQHGSYNGQNEDGELQAVTPRWKMSSQHYVPPKSLGDLSAQSNPYGDGGRPPRAMSPPPELRNSYFPKGSDFLPGYLPGDYLMPPPPTHLDLTRVRSNGSGSGSESGGKKYTASSLGLKKESRARMKDEGYRSLDSRDPPLGWSSRYMESPYGEYGPAGTGFDMVSSMPNLQGRGNRTSYPGPEYRIRGSQY